MKVGACSHNGIELENGQIIKIYDKEDAYRIVVDGYIWYTPSAFMVHDNGANKDYLLYWYLKYDRKDQYEIEVIV
jgi:hypothetical protein